MLKKRTYFYFSITLLVLFCSFFSYSSALNISGKSAILIEADSGKIIYEKNADLRLPMASTTKIMTGILAIENNNLSDIVKIPPCAVGIEGSSIYLKEGESLSVRQLLEALLLESANDASVALAYKTAGDVSHFAELMNEKATELGLTNTHFANPHGLDDDEHYTTASDLSKIARYAMQNPVFAEIVSTKKSTIPLNNGEGTRMLVNHNKLLRSYKGANGIKTGYTKRCGRCFVSSAEVDGVRLICVTLNAPNDWRDHTTLLDYGFSLYESYNLADPKDYLIELDIRNGEKNSVLVSNDKAFKITLKKDNHDFSADLEYNPDLSAPIKKGDVLGKIIFFDYGKKIGEIDLISQENINKPKQKNFFERLFNYGKN